MLGGSRVLSKTIIPAVRQCPSEGVATPYSVQGLEQNIGHFSQLLGDRFWDSVPFSKG